MSFPLSIFIIAFAFLFSAGVVLASTPASGGSTDTDANYENLTATNAQFSTIKVGTEESGGVAYFYGSLLNSSTGIDGSDNPLNIADTLQPTGDYSLGTTSSRWSTVYGKSANFSEAVQVASLTVGSQGVGGVTYFNGTIVNNTTGDNDSNTPVTIGDNLRVDGTISRMGEGGDYPVKLADTLIPTSDDTYSLGTSSSKWSNLYAEDATFTGTVNIANLEGVNNVTTTNIVNNSVTSAKLVDNSVTNTKVTDESISEAKLDVMDTPSNGDHLAWNSTNSQFEWVVPSSGSGSGDLLSTNNLSDLADAGTARTNLGLAIGTDVQAYDADLTTYAGITPSANVQTLLGSADFAAAKTNLSLNSVENTAISTWVGTTNVTTLGTIATGTWSGTAIADAKVDNDLTISGGTVNNSIIGATTPAAGTFANLQTGYDGADGQLTIYADQATDRSVIIQPNAAMTESTTYTLPPDNGDANEVLTSDGAGALSWGGTFVDRGDIADVDGSDYSLGDLTIDGTWNDLDLGTDIPIPAGAGAVLLNIIIIDDEHSSVIGFREKGNAGFWNASNIRTQVANVVIEDTTVVALDANREIQYKADNGRFAPGATIEVTVRGWWL